MKQLDYNATVAQRLEISPATIVLRIAPDEKLFDFESGQYTILGLKQKEERIHDSEPETDDEKQTDPEKMIRRAYSISSSSLENEFLEFFITVVRSGALTPRLLNLKNGDRIYLGPKATGMFTLDQVQEEKNLLFVSTGTGLAPYISMVRTHLANQPNRQFVIIHGARYSWDLGYRDELTTLSRVCPNLTYLPTVSHPENDPTWSGQTGRVQNVLTSGTIEKETGLSLTPEYFDLFLCGNPNMIVSVREIMEGREFVKGNRKNPGTIHIEEYWK